MKVYLSLGSNLGDRLENLRGAAGALEERGIRVVRASGLYETAPVGWQQQPDFYNAVLEVEAGITLPRLLRLVQEIEQERGGRPEGAGRARYADVDVLLCGAVVFSSADLVVPHPRMFERRFVLEPLAELEAGVSDAWGWALPVGGRPADWEQQGVRRVAEAEEWLAAASRRGTEVGRCGSLTPP